VMVLMKGVLIGTLYKLSGNIESSRCNNIFSPEIDSNVTPIDSMSTKIDLTRVNSVQIDSTRHDELDPTKLWHEMMGHIGEK
jgi:hypothetical protein